MVLDGSQQVGGGHICNPQLPALRLRSLLEQVRRGNVNASAGVLDEQHGEAGLEQVAGSEETADVRRQTAHRYVGHAASPQQGGQSRMLGGDSVGLEVAVVTLAPDRV